MKPDNTPVDIGTTWQFTTSTTAGSDIAVKAAVANARNYLTDITISNSSGAAVVVFIKDGSSGKWQALIPAGGTVTKQFLTPIRGTVNTAINVTPAGATTTLYVSASGYTA